MTPKPLLMTCLGCRRAAGLKSCAGACACPDDGLAVTLHIQQTGCPRGHFTPTGDRVPDGVGTVLKAMLAKLGIVPVPGCQCNQRAAEMDARGPAWCAANVETIVGWLREEAEKRGLVASLAARPFVLRRLVKRAIARAEEASQPSSGE